MHTMSKEDECPQTDKRHILKRILVFDLDDCIYPKSCGIKVCVHQNITKILFDIIMERKKNNLSVPSEVENISEFDFEEFERLAYKLYLAHGTTLNGLLKLGYIPQPEIESDEDALVQYNHKAHNFSFDETNLTKNDEDLISLFEKLKKNHQLSENDDIQQAGLIALFTNADRRHAQRILEFLGIRHFFDFGVHFEELRMLGKPHEYSYKYVEQQCQEFISNKNKLASGDKDLNPSNQQWVIDPKITQFVFFDDNILNVKKAVDLGWQGIWVAENLKQGEKIPPLAKHEKELEAELEPNGGKIKIIRSILDIPEIFPEFLL